MVSWTLLKLCNVTHCLQLYLRVFCLVFSTENTVVQPGWRTRRGRVTRGGTVSEEQSLPSRVRRSRVVSASRGTTARLAAPGSWTVLRVSTVRTPNSRPPPGTVAKDSTAGSGPTHQLHLTAQRVSSVSSFTIR